MPPSNTPLITADELATYGINPDFLQPFTPDVIAANIQAVTDEVIGRFKPTIVPPVSNPGADVKAAVAAIVAYELKSIQGLAPTEAAVGDDNLFQRAKAKREWCDAVGRGEIEPQLTDSSIDGEGGEPMLMPMSDDQRNW